MGAAVLFPLFSLVILTVGFLPPCQEHVPFPAALPPALCVMAPINFFLAFEFFPIALVVWVPPLVYGASLPLGLQAFRLGCC